MSELEALDAEIGRLQAEAASIERMPTTIAERFAIVERELREAEQVFRTYGLNVSAGHPVEASHLKQRAMLGAMMVIGSAQLFQVEHARIEAQGEGLSAPAKAERLAQLRRQIERLCAARELQLREREAPGEFLPRPALHAEMAVFRKPDLELLAR